MKPKQKKLKVDDPPPPPERTDAETQALGEDQRRRFGPGGGEVGRLSTMLTGGLVSKLGGV